MSEENTEEDGRINHASDIIAAAKGKIKITQAMKLVGFSTPERKNITVCQRARRRSQQLTVVAIAPRTIKKSSLFEVESALSCTEESVPASSGIDVDTDSNRTAVTPWRLDTDTGTSPESNNAGNTATAGDTATADTGAETRAGVAGSRKRVAPYLSSQEGTTASVKRRRRSSKQVQDAQAAVRRQAEKERKAMKLTTVRIKHNVGLPRGHKAKKSILTIVKEVNVLCDSNVSHKTAAMYVRKGLINVSPQKRGPVGDFTKPMLMALTWACATFLKLEQAQAKQQSSLRTLSLRINACVNEAGMKKSRDDLTRKL